MPCDCEDEENELVMLRFIGGRHKKGRERGPYLSYETGKLYEVRASYADVPWWELPDKKKKKKAVPKPTDKEIPPMSEDERNEIVKLRFIGGEHKKGRERGPYKTYETGKVYELRKSLATVPWFELVDEDVEEETVVKSTDEKGYAPSKGLTRGFNGKLPLPEEFIYSMDDEQLKKFIEDHGGKVDGRWGRKKLEAEALAHQQ